MWTTTNQMTVTGTSSGFGLEMARMALANGERGHVDILQACQYLLRVKVLYARSQDR